MAKKVAALIGAAVIALTALAPSVASADPRHRGGDRGYYDNHRGHYDGRRDYRRHDDNDDALAAGVVGLVLGAVIGSALSESRRDPPPAYYPPPPRAGYNGGYYDGPPSGYGPGYGPGGYYDQGPQLCVQRQQTWDPYARRYVTLERRVPC